jgi:hypothetical protein
LLRIDDFRAGSGGELPGRGRRAVEDVPDRVEVEPEGLVQHPRDPLVRGESIDHYVERLAHCLLLHCHLFRVAPGRYSPATLQTGRVEWDRDARAQPVEAHACGDRREPSSDVVENRCVLMQADPGELHDVFSLVAIVEDPAGDVYQPPTLTPKNIRRHHGFTLSRLTTLAVFTPGNT